MNKLEKSLSLIERTNFLGKQHLLTESQESSSQKEAIRYVEQHFGWSHERANNFVRVDLRNDITSLRDKKIGKFTLGVTRMFCNGELRDARIKSDLNATLKLLSAHLNEYDRNLNGLSASELIQRFSKHRQDNLDAEKKDIDAMDFSNSSNYEIVPINSFEEANQYYKYTNPNSRWCLTHMEDMFDSYTCGGINQIYFCLQNGFESIPPKVGEDAPLDEYGLSMLSIIVNENGELAYCTTRWNHDNGGSDSAMTAKEISQVVGVNFYAVFKPNNKWKDLLAQVEQQLANGEDPRDVFDWVNSFNEGFAVVELYDKCNFINTEGKFLSSQWFDGAWDFSEGFAVVRLDKKHNFINTEGKFLSSKWFDGAWDFSEGFAKIGLNGKYNFINTEGRLISSKWFDGARNFFKGFAVVGLNGKYNYLNTEGKLISSQWFDCNRNFSDGFAVVGLNGKYNYLNTEGKLISSKWFDWGESFFEGFAMVGLNGKDYRLNAKGELVENKQYKTNRNMKQVIRLTESDLHRVIKESVNKILNENDFHRAYKRSKNLSVLGSKGTYTDDEVFDCLETLKKKLELERKRASSGQYDGTGEAMNYLVGAIKGLQAFIDSHY